MSCRTRAPAIQVRGLPAGLVDHAFGIGTPSTRTSYSIGPTASVALIQESSEHQHSGEPS